MIEVCRKHIFTIMLGLSMVTHLTAFSIASFSAEAETPDKHFIELKVRLGNGMKTQLSENGNETRKNKHQTKVAANKNTSATKKRSASKASPKKTSNRKQHIKPVLERTALEKTLQAPRVKKLEKVETAKEEKMPALANVGSRAGNSKNKSKRHIKLSYEKMLPLWINQFWKYPEEAKRQGITGEGVVFITIDRGGNVLKVLVKESTGSQILDDALLQMISDADPVLPLPDDYYPTKVTRSYEIRFGFYP